MEKNSIKFSDKASKVLRNNRLVLIDSDFYHELSHPEHLWCDINPSLATEECYIKCSLKDLRSTLSLLTPKAADGCIINLILSSGEYLSSFGEVEYYDNSPLCIILDMYYGAIELCDTKELYHVKKSQMLITGEEFDELVQNFYNYVDNQ